MANYIKSTDFAIKDGLITGDPLKIVKGVEINDEFNAIQVAINSKADINSPSLTGVPLAPTAAPGTNTTQIATTAFVKTTVDTATANLGTMATQNANAVAITGGTISGLSSPLSVASGGTGRNSLTANNVLLGNGTSSVNFVAPGTSNNVLASDGTTWFSTPFTTILNNAGGVIGIGQTWQSVSRSSGVTYTNTTGKPIQIAVTVTTNQFTSSVLRINGSVVSSIAGGDFGNYQGYYAIIPNGATYLVTQGFQIRNWWELR